jgi:Aerotolerance regulator N-terminal/von Willebrand factor type A domain
MAAGALVGVPIVLHLLRRRPRVEVFFPSLRFLGPTAARDSRAHSIRRWITLLLRCAVILLICAAFSRPFLAAVRPATGQSVVVAVDNSFSMQASGRWEPLRQWAQAALAGLRPGDEAGVLLMNPSPRWLVPLTPNLDQARAALASLKPGYEITRYNAALRLAAETLVHSGTRDMTIAWMADEQRLGWQNVDFAQALPSHVKIEFAPAPDAPRRQAAITDVRWEESADVPTLRVSVSQFLPQHDTRVLAVGEAGQVLATLRVPLDADGPNIVHVALPGLSAATEHALRVDLDPDDLPVDDTFYVTAGAHSKPKVFLTYLEAKPEAFNYIMAALASTREMAPLPLQPEVLPDAEWPKGAVVIVRGSAAFEPPNVGRLERFLDSGGQAWILVDGSPSQVSWLSKNHVTVNPVAKAGGQHSLHIRNWDLDHPILAPLAGSLGNLLRVEWYSGFSVEGPEERSLATWEDGSGAIAEVNHEGRHFLVTGFDLSREATDWPVHSSFVPFVHSTAAWLAGAGQSPGDWHVGDLIPLAGGGTWTPIDAPREAAPVTVTDSIRPDMPGLYRRTGAGPAEVLAVNVRTEESDLRTWDGPGDFHALVSPDNRSVAARDRTVDLPREDAESGQRLWWWCLAAALVLLAAELGLSNRTSL